MYVDAARGAELLALVHPNVYEDLGRPPKVADWTVTYDENYKIVRHTVDGVVWEPQP